MPNSLKDDGFSLVYLQEMGENMRQVSASVTDMKQIMHVHALMLNSLKDEFGGLKSNVDSLAKLVRDGNGQHSLVTKVALLETRLDRVSEWQSRSEDREAEDGRVHYNTKWQVWSAVAAAVISAVVTIIAAIK